jgi:hypothetical protein
MQYFYILSLLLSLTFSGIANKPPRKIEIRAGTIPSFEIMNPSQIHFGALEFRGGLVLSSPDRAFGGFSSIKVQPDGSRFLSLSDEGSWLQGRIVYDGTRPIGVDEAIMAPMLDSRCRPTQWDAESMAEDGDTLFVGVERINEIFRFNFGKKGLLACGYPIAVPPGIKDLPHNKGLEAMVFVPKKQRLGGTLIAISERGLDKAGNLKAFLIGGQDPGNFFIKRTNDYDISDAALLPGGDLLILERHYSLLRGIAIRIRRILLAQIKPGALVDGPALFEADMRCQIDNMEGLSVHQSPSGQVVLTMISDDNFSPLQRTLLLQFSLMRE